MKTHPDDAAFLAAILANPGDDLVRLVYADYLDKTRRGERAEFVRVQCEMASAPGVMPDAPSVPFAPCPEPDCRECALRRREAELLAEYGNDWFADEVSRPADWRWHARPEHIPASYTWVANDCGIFHVPPHEYRRGFVSRVTCSWDDWRRHAAALRAAAPLERVTLTTRPEFAEFYVGVNGFARLEGCGHREPTPLMFGLDGLDRVTLFCLAAEYPGLAFDLPPPDNRITITNVPLYVSDLSAPTGIPWESVDSAIPIGGLDAAGNFQLARIDADRRILVGGVPPVEWVRQPDGSWHATGPSGHRFLIPAGEVNEPPGATP